MKTIKRKAKTKKGLLEYTYLGCPITRNKTAWCYRICKTDEEGYGFCGRVAPHSLKSTIQESIEKHNRKKLEIHFQRLEQYYLSASQNSLNTPGIKISENKVEIIYSVSKQICHPDGSLQSEICSKLLHDAATLVINSKVPDVFVLTEHFNFYLSNKLASGQLIARARFLNKSGDQYLAEAIIVDSNRTEIARGSGVFIKSNIPIITDPNFT
jgi:hypothetical protein